MRPASFAAYITAAREERGYSLRHLARRLGVQPSTISRLESGTRTLLPTPDVFIGLIDELRLEWSTALSLVPPYDRLWRDLTARALSSLPREARDELEKRL